jgi:phthiocerol/phenolphthiocerol synthesis type-I polyketide synthase E
MSNLTDQNVMAQPSTTAIEQALAEMWRDLLQVSKVEPNDDFFALGGTSLTAIKLLQRVEEAYGTDVLPPDTLYGDPKLRSVAKAIDEAIQDR